jgi:parallel beta-helix repeat protein
MKFYLKLLIASCFILLTITKLSCQTTAIYVASNGSDKNGNGTSTLPYLTIQKALTKAISLNANKIYLIPGVWNISAEQEISGGNPNGMEILISKDPLMSGDVIFDGKSISNEPTNSGVLFFNSCSNLTIRHITVRNNPVGHGIKIDFGRNIKIEECIVHSNKQKGIQSSGDFLLFFGNELYNNCRQNLNGIQQTNGLGWPNVLNVRYKPDNTRSSNITFKNNSVHDNWGEGICSIFSDTVNISNNRVYNNWSGNVLVESASNVIVSSNYLYNHPDSAFMQDNVLTFRKEKCSGIIIGTEWLDNSALPYSMCSNIMIINNIMNYTKHGITFIYPQKTALTIPQFNSYNTIKIYHNTLRNMQASGVNFVAVPDIIGNVQPSGCEMINNIISAGAAGSSSSLNLGDNTDKMAWIIRNNTFPSGIPSSDLTGTINSNNNQLVPSFLYNETELTDKCALLNNSNKLSDKGYDLIITVSSDYFGNKRTLKTTIGAHEVDINTTNEDTLTDSNLTVKISGNEVTVSGYNVDFPLEVFDFSGRKIYYFDTKQNSYIIKLQKGTVYLLKNGNSKPYKLLM